MMYADWRSVMKKKENGMGKVWAEVELFNAGDEYMFKEGKLPAGKIRKIDVKALVDTGATMLLLPEKDIQRLGLRLSRTVKSRVADGRLVERKIYGPVTVKVFKRTMQTEAAAGAPNLPPLLGQIPLEGLDLLVDAKNQCLILNPESPDPEMALIDIF